ncbi:hypothetical protein GCM10007424_26820 [Flavobacterium suaedae]|uniref:WYL domain-containing protein n=1 Tax=Flavobacterium suaedae TaxID=1767027 RepID=A0ABQ1K5S3_9FLAO|nr:hypothetical protein GCM10007424_26820 [Flavobacterium suaedae]
MYVNRKSNWDIFEIKYYEMTQETLTICYDDGSHRSVKLDDVRKINKINGYYIFFLKRGHLEIIHQKSFQLIAELKWFKDYIYSYK